MAAMVEGYSKGRTKRGADFIRADFSDSSGQFSAACFEESLVPQFERWASDGTCLLLTVELDAPNPNDPPRVTVRGARPLDEVKGATRMILTLDVMTPEALTELKLQLGTEGGGESEVVARLVLGGGRDVYVRLGRNFTLDGDLAERISAVQGLDKVMLQPLRSKASLRLVA